MNYFVALRVPGLKSPSGFVTEGHLNQLVYCCQDLGDLSKQMDEQPPSNVALRRLNSAWLRQIFIQMYLI